MDTYGRKTLYSSLRKEDINENTILEALNSLLPRHEVNKGETLYLKDYLVGKQDIRFKQKFTREKINNKLVENWTYAITEFMKSFILNEPIQYVQTNNGTSEELSVLNDYLTYEDKAQKDMDLLEDLVLCGRGFRFVAPDGITEDDESPFEIQNIDVDKCEIVYSSGIGKKQLFAFVETPMEEVVTRIVDNQELEYTNEYSIYTVYTENKVYTYTTQNGILEYVRQDEESTNLYPVGHRIIEYYFNRNRLSLLEVVKPILDKINKLESLDMDDMEQFVNALMVFKNANITEETIAQGKELGALLLKSDNNMPADVELLQNRLNADSTQIFYNRLISAMLSIVAMPYSTDNGSYGDTGVAKMTGQGWTMSDQRTTPLTTAFASGDKKILKYILKICKVSKNSEIKNLKLKDIDIRFKINRNANILEKTQALLNMKTAQISPNIAIPTTKLFNDDQNAITESMDFYGEENFWRDNGTSEEKQINDINEQNNEIQDVLEEDKQNNI